MLVAIRSAVTYTELADSQTLYLFFQWLLNANNNVLLVRLYKKYVRMKDVNSTLNILRFFLSQQFGRRKKMFQSLVEKLERCAENSEFFFKAGRDYEPLRLELLDLPYSILNKNIPLADYDNNEGEPFWMRPEYILEHYSQK